MALMRGRYIWRIEQNLLLITDRNLGDRSVTNEVEQVLVDLAGLSIDIAKQRIIYRDSDGIWDGILTRAGQFVAFFPLRCRSEQAAIALAQALDPWPFEGL